MLPPALEPLLALAPQRGEQVEVTMREGSPSNGHDDRNAEVRIAFRDRASRDRDAHRHRETSVSREASPQGDPMPGLIEVLAEAESRPQLRFIALKFLRDRLLPDTHHAWARSPQSCQAVIGEAIDRGILLTSKTPNPRNPDFPVTAVELNRDHPIVREHVGDLPPVARAEAEGQAEAAS